MIKNGKGGGNTRTGLIFEGKTDLSVFLKVINASRTNCEFIYLYLLRDK